MSIFEIIRKLTDQFTPYSSSPRLDAELLVGSVINQSRAQLFAYPDTVLTAAQEKQIELYTKCHIAGEPIAYLLGHQEFWSLELIVNSDVLIPRPETECLVEWVLDNMPDEKEMRIADLGTGSGAIAIALASERKNWMIDAVDNSEKALAVAKENAIRHAAHKVQFFKGEWCNALPHNAYQVIVSNPPYVANGDPHLQKLHYEPGGALSSGDDGLDAIAQIISQARNYLLPGGWLVLEHGFDQGERVIELMEKQQYSEVVDYPDLAGLPRMIVGKYE